MPYPTLSGGFLALCRLIVKKRAEESPRHFITIVEDAAALTETKRISTLC